MADLFPGLIIDGAHAFRVTRNSDLYVDEEEADNLLRSIEQELRRSSRGTRSCKCRARPRDSSSCRAAKRTIRPGITSISRRSSNITSPIFFPA
ncbi:MAG: hypothetical protein ACRD5Z_09920 [Bryobacteraceae bacterium]